MQNKAKQNIYISANAVALFRVSNTTHVYRDNHVLNFNITYTQLWVFI